MRIRSFITTCLLTIACCAQAQLPMDCPPSIVTFSDLDLLPGGPIVGPRQQSSGPAATRETITLATGEVYEFDQRLGYHVVGSGAQLQNGFGFKALADGATFGEFRVQVTSVSYDGDSSRGFDLLRNRIRIDFSESSDLSSVGLLLYVQDEAGNLADGLISVNAPYVDAAGMFASLNNSSGFDFSNIASFSLNVIGTGSFNQDSEVFIEALAVEDGAFLEVQNKEPSNYFQLVGPQSRFLPTVNRTVNLYDGDVTFSETVGADTPSGTVFVRSAEGVYIEATSDGVLPAAVRLSLASQLSGSSLDIAHQLFRIELTGDTTLQRSDARLEVEYNFVDAFGPQSRFLHIPLVQVVTEISGAEIIDLAASDPSHSEFNPKAVSRIDVAVYGSQAMTVGERIGVRSFGIMGPRPKFAPVAEAALDVAFGEAPMPVNFDASGSSDPDAGLSCYHWDFGDGNTADGLLASHTYLVPGIYTVTLTVTDTDGLSGQTTRLIEVVAPPEVGECVGVSSVFTDFDLIDSSSLTGPANSSGPSSSVTRDIFIDGYRLQYDERVESYFVRENTVVTESGEVIATADGSQMANITYSYQNFSNPYTGESYLDLLNNGLEIHLLEGTDLSRVSVSVRATDRFGEQAYLDVTASGVVVSAGNLEPLDLFGFEDFDPSRIIFLSIDISTASSFNLGESYGLDYMLIRPAVPVPLITFETLQGGPISGPGILNNAGSERREIGFLGAVREVEERLFANIPASTQLDSDEDGTFMRFDVDGPAQGNFAGELYLVPPSQPYLRMTGRSITVHLRNEATADKTNVELFLVSADSYSISIPITNATQTITFEQLQAAADTQTLGEFDFGGVLQIALSVSFNNTFTAGETVGVRSVDVSAPIAAVPPLATFDVETTFGAAPLALNFDASASLSGDAPIACYEWDFDDGSDPVFGAQQAITFDEAGAYDVQLTVTDVKGVRSTFTQRIEVTADPLETFLANAGVPSTEWGLDDDWDADGNSNVIELLYQLDPSDADTIEIHRSSGTQTGASLNTATGTNDFVSTEEYVTFSVLLPNELFGYNLQIQTASDLSNFTNTLIANRTVGAPVPEGADFVRVTIVIESPMQSTPKAFLRIQVTE